MRSPNLCLFFVGILFLQVVFCSKIVIVYSIVSQSHFLSLKPAIEALAERGHQVTLFTPFQGITKGILNVREFVLEDTAKMIQNDIYIDWFEMQKAGQLRLLKMMIDMVELMATAASETLKHEEFNRIVSERDVDLFIVDAFGHEYVFPVADSLEVPCVTHCSTSPIPMLLSVVGGLDEYASVPSPFTEFDENMTFFQRFQNFLHSQIFLLVRNLIIIPKMDRIVSEQFPKAKSISQLESSVSLTIINSHPATSFQRSLPPAVIPIAALHTRPAKELPQKFKEFADGAKHGLIVFTLGSFIPVSSMPQETMGIFLRVFSKLPQRVVWKWEAAPPVNLSANILTAEWIPQQDLLGHPNTKLLMSHGGMMGTQEAIFHGVPILSLPFSGDQKSNVIKPIRNGYALQLDWDKLDEGILFSSILHLVNDPNVRKNVVKASELMKDELIPGKALAVYWIERVIRDKGIKYLQLPSKDMPFYKRHMLDVLGLFFFIFCVSVYVLFRFGWVLLKRVSTKYLTKNRNAREKKN